MRGRQQLSEWLSTKHIAFARRINPVGRVGLTARKLPQGCQPGEARHYPLQPGSPRSEVHTYELQSLMRISYAVFCFQKNTQIPNILRHSTSAVNVTYTHTSVILNS